MEVGSQAEKISQLQVEKEKAVADLIAIRKINRNIEKYVFQSIMPLLTYNVCIALSIGSSDTNVCLFAGRLVKQKWLHQHQLR